MKQEHIEMALVMCLAVNDRHYDDNYINTVLQNYFVETDTHPSFGFKHVHNVLCPGLIRSVKVNIDFSESNVDIELFDLTWAGRWLLFSQLTLQRYSLFEQCNGTTHHWANHYKTELAIEEHTESVDVKSQMRKLYLETTNPKDILVAIHGPKALRSID